MLTVGRSSPTATVMAKLNRKENIMRLSKTGIQVDFKYIKSEQDAYQMAWRFPGLIVRYKDTVMFAEDCDFSHGIDQYSILHKSESGVNSWTYLPEVEI